MEKILNPKREGLPYHWYWIDPYRASREELIEVVDFIASEGRLLWLHDESPLVRRQIVKPTRWNPNSHKLERIDERDTSHT